MSFKPKTILECRHCGTRIKSSRSGDWVHHHCPSMGIDATGKEVIFYVDETEWYCRVGGDGTHFKIIGELSTTGEV